MYHSSLIERPPPFPIQIITHFFIIITVLTHSNTFPYRRDLSTENEQIKLIQFVKILHSIFNFISKHYSLRSIKERIILWHYEVSDVSLGRITAQHV